MAASLSTQPIFQSKPLVLGREVERNCDLNLSETERSMHMHVLGATGTGKSRFLLSLIQQDILEDRGLCLLDPHGELYAHLVEWISNNEWLAKRRKIRFIDLANPDWSLGFNPLKATTPAHIPATVDAVTRGIAHVFGGKDLNETPLIKATLDAVCMALADKELTLLESPYLMLYEEREVREKITRDLSSRVYDRLWSHSLNRLGRSDYQNNFESTERRLRSFINNDVVRRIFGQNNNVLDFRKAMDEGEIILVNLMPSGGMVPSESLRLIGLLIVHNLIAKAYERDPLTKPRPFYLYLDEAQNYVSNEIPEILSQCRKFGLSMVLAHQYLQQLRNAGELVYQGVMANARTKVVFGIEWDDDAAIMSRRIFRGTFDYEKPKKSLIRPVVVGHKRTQLHTTTYTDGSSESVAQSNTNTTGESRSYSTGESQGTATGEGVGDSLGQVAHDPSQIGSNEIMRASETLSNFSSSSDFSSTSSSEAHGHSSSESTSEARGRAKASSTSKAYAESLEPILKWLPTAVYSLEEQRQIFTDKIMGLGKRRAFVAMPDRPSAEIATLDVPDQSKSEKRLVRISEGLFEDCPYLNAVDEVDEEIIARTKGLENTQCAELTDEDFFE